MSLLKPLLTLCLTTLSSIIIISAAINSIPQLTLPTSIELIQNQISHLRAYSLSSTSHSLHLSLVLSLIFISKQAFSIPGTALLNILIGSIYPIWISTPLSCLLTAIGSTAAYLIARTSRPLIIKLIPRPLKLIQRAVDPFRIEGSHNRYHTAQLSSYLLIARFLPIVPYAALNLASGVLELPLIPFFWTLLIGSLPYNLLTTQLGDILRTAAESNSSAEHPRLTEIWTIGLLLKLISLSLLAILPILFKQSLTNAIQRLVQTTPLHQLSHRKIIPSPIITHNHHHQQQGEEEDEEDQMIVQLSPSTTTSSSLDDHYASSQLIINLDNLDKSNKLDPIPNNHIPLGLNILTDNTNNNHSHLITLDPHTHPSSVFDLPYRQLTRLSCSP